MPNQFILNEDKTGTLVSNLITNEIHELATNNSLLIPRYLTYFTNSVSVKAIDINNLETTLLKNVDFITLDFNAKLTKKIGEELCSTILLKDKKNCNKFSITYQAYGGFLNPNYTELINSIKNLTSTIIVDWKDILNKPDGFPVKNPHRHIWDDVYGMEYLVDTVDRLIDSVENNPSFADLNLPSRITSYFNSIPNISKPILNNTHATSSDNFHKLTKQQVNLSNIENYPVISSYTSILNATPLSEATLYKEFENRKQIRYITNNVVYSYIQEILQIQIDKLDSKINNYNTTLNSLNTKLNNLETQFNNSTLDIANTSNNLSDATIDKTTIVNNFKQYRLFNWNYEVAKVTKAMLEKEYLLSSNYSDIYNIFEYLDLPYLWLDFSDLSTITLDGSNKVSSIIDKSNYGRVFNQNNPAYRPLLVTNPNIGIDSVNRNNSALFSQDTYLSQILANNVINLNRNFSFVLLTKTISSIDSTNCIISGNNNYLYTNKNTKSISLETTKYFIDSVSNSSQDNKTMLTFLNVCDDGVGITYTNSNIANNNVVTSNINSINKLNSNDLIFDSIGHKTRSLNHNFNLCELMIFNRLISKEEIITINSYLSRKWSGSTDFSINLTNLNSL